MQYINLLATCKYKQHTDTHTHTQIVTLMLAAVDWLFHHFQAKCYWLLQRLCAMLYYRYTKMKCSKREYAK